MSRCVVVMVMVWRLALPHAHAHHIPIPTKTGEPQEMSMWGAATKAVLEEFLAPRCSLVLVTDSSFILFSLVQVLRSSWAVKLLQVDGNNRTLALLPKVVKVARKMRRQAWCVAVLVASVDPSFLLAFARESRTNRLLACETRLMVVTNLPALEARDLLRRHWTFSMMNTVLLNLDAAAARGTVLAHLPYSGEGGRVVGVAQWSSTRGLTHQGDALLLYPHKFSNFHGAKIPITSLIMKPFWKVVNPTATESWSRYSGRDCLILKAVGRSLNFTFHMYESANTGEVLAAIQADRAMISVMRLVLIPEFLAVSEPSYFLDRASFTFSMAIPSVQPQWRSLYYPLGHWVWLSILVSTLAMSCFMYVIFHMDDMMARAMRSRSAVLETVGMLLGHDSRLLIPKRTCVRILVLMWLVVGLVITTGYKSTLIAFLSAPKYPSRPETVEELAKANVRSVFLQKSSKFAVYLQESNIPAYRSVTSRMDTQDTTPLKALQHISEHRKAFFYERYNTMLLIAEHFTTPDGSSHLYVARQNVFPHYAAWLMPHDAPYKAALDHALSRVIQSGLKEKFMDDMLREAWQEIRVKKRHHRKTDQNETSNLEQASPHKKLGLSHVQGSFWILLLGALVAAGAFLGELVTPRAALTGHSISSCCRD